MNRKVLFIIVSIVMLIGFTSCDPIAKSIAEGVEAIDPATDAQVHEKYFDIDANGKASLKENQTDLPVSLLIPEKVGTVAVKSIGSCEGSFETVRIPGHVKTICEYAFLNCPMLKYVVIEDGVQLIEEDAFAGCELKQVNINSTLTKITIEPGAFPMSSTTEYWLRTQRYSNIGELMEALNVN